MSMNSVAACLALIGAAPALRAAEPEAPPTHADAAEFADQILDVADRISDHYYTGISKGQLIDWAVRGLYFRCRGVDAPPEFAERLEKAGQMKETELWDLLIDVRKDVQTGSLLGERYYTLQLSKDRYIDLALEEMCRRLDEGTRVIYGGARFRLGGGESSPVGLGLRLRSDPTTGLLEVITPSLEGPAYKEGIRAGDLIREITIFDQPGGEPLKSPEVTSAKGLSPAAAQRRLIGYAGTKVRLLVRRPGQEKDREYNVTRGHAPEESVFGVRRKEDDRWDYWIDAEKKIGYVRIGLFSDDKIDERDTLETVKAALEDLRKGGAKGLILDLRFCKGGLFSSMADVAALFLHKGDLVTSVHWAKHKAEEVRTEQEGGGYDFPVVCLVNGESLRAAEVLAACLQDHQRAVVMGERTPGDCGIRNLMSLRFDRMLFVTSASLYRPSGRKLFRPRVADAPDDDEWGVTPDAGHVVNLPADERRALAEAMDRQTYIFPRDRKGEAEHPDFKDCQLDAAVAYLRSQGGKP